jgi:thioesterase domain-containing protein/acyl carrier protein
MLPAVIHLRDSIPLTPSGKIDRRALEVSAPDLLASENKKQYIPPRDDLDRQLCRIWEEILNTEQVGIQDNFFELGGHSLLAVRLFTEIERQLSVHIPVASLFQAPTVSQQADLIQEKQVPSGISPIIAIQGNGTKPPFFCIHNFGGFVINYEPLSQALGTDQPFYGLQAFGLEGINEPHTTIMDMANYYSQAIRQQQPAGPYSLGGSCFGGAFMKRGRWLVGQGDKVGLLALIDAYAPSHAQKNNAGSWGRFVAVCRNLPYWLRDYSQLNADEKRVVVNRRVKRLRISLQNRLGKPANITARELVGDHANVTSAPDHLQHLMELHMLALMKYSPPIYDGKVTLFRIQRLPLFTHYEPDLGWSQCAAGGVELHIIPGAHHNALMPPFVQGLANEVHSCLENAYKLGP